MADGALPLQRRTITLRRAEVDVIAAPTPPATTERAIDLVASTEAVDSYNEIIDQASWKLARFRANPIALFQHAPWVDPIGFWRNVRVEDGALRGTLVLYDAETSPEADKVWRRYCQGGPVACSVGFYTGRCEDVEVEGRKVRKLFDCDLEEISVVTTPANPEAVAAARRRAAKRAASHRGPRPHTPARKANTMDFETLLSDRGIDPAELAAKAGMTTEELMGGEMTAEQLEAIAELLEMEPAELSKLFGEPEGEEPAEGEGTDGGEGSEDPAPKAGEGEPDMKALLRALGAKNPREALVKANALRHSTAEAGPLAARVKALETERETTRRNAALDAARRSGVLTPAREKGPVGVYLRTLKSAAEVEVYLSTLTPAVPSQKSATRPEEEPTGDALRVSDRDLEEAAEAAGVSIKSLKEARAAAAKRRAAERP